jgi:diaminopimelate decarboxylase
MRIYLSGLHSDPDPSPGLGEALSLREAFPDVELVGVDYSLRSSGIHHPVFDRVLIQTKWSDLDLDGYALWISELLADPTSCWLSGLDVEIAWLSRALPDKQRILNPLRAVELSCTKPEMRFAGLLGMAVPEWHWYSTDPAPLRRLGEKTGWRLWVKGAFCEALPARSYTQLLERVAELESGWPSTRAIIQAHVEGEERAYVFAGLRGRLLDAVEIEKCSFTEGRKTWGAKVHRLSDRTRQRLSDFVARTNWTGGGEVEFIQTYQAAFAIDINPRFPANIYGVTLCGHNLPAQLVADFLGLNVPSRALRPHSNEFTRLVIEVPTRVGYPLPAYSASESSIHPSYEPLLARRLRSVDGSHNRADSPILGRRLEQIAGPGGDPESGKGAGDPSAG